MVDDSQQLSVRIVKVDYYLTKPVAELDDPCYSGFRSSPVYHVPVLRIFGSTPEGTKCCVHVHGVFPYIFIPNWNREIREKDFYAFASSLDKAINTSFACSSSKTCHVHRINATSRRPYYGYYEGEREFLKIEFYNPAIVKRASDLLLNAAVFNINYQPYEAHVPFILQFFIDNNLYGMSYAKFSSYRIRSMADSVAVKQTNMVLEVDCCVKNILCEFMTGDDVPNNPGLAFIWEEERKRRRMQKDESQITPNVSQTRPDHKATKTELYYKNKLAEKLKRYVNQNVADKESTSSSAAIEDEEEVAVPLDERLNPLANDIFVLLEELAPHRGPDYVDRKPISSQCSTPSIVYSDDEIEPQPVANIGLIRSQPLLKQSAENDSILGDDFSDDEIDEEDHMILSQSVYRPLEESSDDEFIGELNSISQLDGADGADIPPIGLKKPTKRDDKKKSYNLRSKNKEIQKSKDKKFTPQKQYPQLEISTQVSPRGSQRAAIHSPSIVGSQNPLPSPETFATSFVRDNFCSPTSRSQIEARKSESKRIYPQLNVNFQKSPRNEIKIDSDNDIKRRKLSSSFRKRKIDFDILDSKESSETMTTRWKRLQRLKKNMASPSTTGNDGNEIANVEDLDMIAPNATYIVKEKEKSQLISNSSMFHTEIGSQKYSLKIRFDACGSVDREVILENLLTKEPVVMLEKIDYPNSSAEGVKNVGECSRESQSGVVENQDDEPVLNDGECSPRKPSQMEENENYAPVLTSLFDFKNSGSSETLSNETKKSEEVQFWDVGVVLRPNVLNLSPSVDGLSDTLIPGSNSISSSEYGSCSSFPKTIEPTQEFSQERELDNDYPTPDIVDDPVLFPNDCLYSSITDEQFSSPEVNFGIKKLHRTEAIIEEERLPDLGIFEASPTFVDDEHLAGTTNAFNFGNEVKTLSSQEEMLKKTMKDAKSMAALYSSINDDVFPEPEIQNKNADSYNDDSDPVMFSQDSKCEKALAEFDLSQVIKLNSDEKRDSNNSSSNQTDVPNNRASKISVKDSSKVFKDQNFAFDNSAWDTIENTNNDDDRIFSFYEDKSLNVISATQFLESNDDDSNKYVSQSEILTPELDRGILTWNNEGESLFNERPSSNDGSLDTDAEMDLRDKLSKKSNIGTLSDGDSPTVLRESVLHSTPQNLAKKKSPSPTYTPIVRKVLLKNINDQTKGTKSRLSSHRFQTEPFLADIKEEEDDSKNDKSVVQKTSPVDAIASTSADKSAIERRSRSSVGSEQIEITMGNTYGFRMSLENLQNVKTETQHQFITVMSIEIFALTRGDLYPDPEFDSVSCISYSIFDDKNESLKLTSGIIIVSNDEYRMDVTRFNCEKDFVKDENELLSHFVTLVEKWDPDIFIGYEIEMLSWGYLIQRAQQLGRNYIVELSRVKDEKKESFKEKTLIEDSEYSEDLKLIGRIVLNVWRLMRHEIALQSYSFENILFHVLHQRVPKHSFRVLTEWWKNPLRRWIVIDYYLLRVESNILLLQQLDFFGRTSELARLFGIQFYEVLSRGSQFRVESMMLRLAKKQNFVAVSPSVKQRAKMRAPESLPLIMEPESKYYTDPVIVLDFQSLYPSIIIAYNYCFSTCLGRVEHLVEKETFNFGCIQHTVPVELVSRLQSSLNISPCGVAFVKQSVRRGILPEMLEEILNTRLMVKKSMKDNKDDKTLQRVLHARQLGLKLIANVTYGYTSANFSGRMPCIEIGDSVVSKGRETLERVVEMVSKNERWAAKVIYGDTDSIFVMVPKRSKEEAFRIGAEIVEAVTNDNPKPVKLKLEKVYYPCILQTKKRYVGYMYESNEQKEPVYDAKGIETVRRDGCPAVAKILEKSLKLLFDHNDPNTVRQYVQRQFTKLVAGRLSIQELTFAREYRGMNNYKPAACVPALQLARQAIIRDRRSEPRVKERVRYVMTVGPPGVPLIKSVRTPDEFLSSPGAIINAEYYITRAIIPALERCFSLLGVDVRVWYAELPRRKKSYLPVENDFNNKAYKKKTISHYFATSKCIACEEIAVTKVCKDCQQNPQKLSLTLGTMINKLQRKYNYLEKICRSCTSRNDSVECSSLDCPSYYFYRQALRDVEQIPYLEELQQTFLRRPKV